MHVLFSQWSPKLALLWIPIYRWGNWGNESKLLGQRHISSRWQSLSLMSGCLSPEFMLLMCLVGFPQEVSIPLVQSVAITLSVGASGENQLWAAAWCMAHSLHLINICWIINSLMSYVSKTRLPFGVNSTFKLNLSVVEKTWLLKG